MAVTSKHNIDVIYLIVTKIVMCGIKKRELLVCCFQFLVDKSVKVAFYNVAHG